MLCIRGIIGKGTLRTYPFSRVPTKAVFLTPKVVEYDGKTMVKPAFDFIIGTKMMTESGIIMDFKKIMITIDEIKLPMQDIK